MLVRLAACLVVVGAFIGCNNQDTAGGTLADAASEGATTTSNRQADDKEDVRGWRTGRATLDLEGDHWEFALDLCAVQTVDPDAAANVASLYVQGMSGGSETVKLAVTETVTYETPARIQVISIHFEDPDGTRLRTLEAQRVVDIETGDVDDFHGDATTPLFEVEEGDQFSVSATNAAFWQFDLSGRGEDGVFGTGDLEATCT